jgi:hypothetical protein
MSIDNGGVEAPPFFLATGKLSPSLLSLHICSFMLSAFYPVAASWMIILPICYHMVLAARGMQ